VPRPTAAAAGIAVVLAFSVAGISPAAASVSRPAATSSTVDDAARTTWALEPASAEGADGRVSLRHGIDPGGEAVDHVTLTNFSPHAAVFDLYPGDGLLTADGQFDLPPTGSEPTDSGSWIALGEGAPGAPQQVEVGAESSVTVPVTLRVPADATPGDHPAGIVAALSSATGSGVGLDSRVGVRLHLRVTGDLAPALTVQDVRASYRPSWNPFTAGTLRIDYVVENTGNVRLGATSTASTAGVFGLGSTSAEGPALREVLPGSSAGGSVEVPAWPLLRATGAVSVEPGVVGDDQITAALATGSADLGVWTLPWPQLVLLLLLVALVLGVRQLRRRRETAVRRRIDAAVAAAR
jgi:hypothetical protein